MINGNPNITLTFEYQNPTPGELPIVGLGNLSGFSFLGNDFLKLQKECGVNIVMALIGTSSAFKDVSCTYLASKPQTGKSCNIYCKPNDKNKGEYGMLIKESIINAKKADLKLIIRFDPKKIETIEEIYPAANSQLREYFRDWYLIIKGFKGDETVVGYNLGDEPTLQYFYGLRETRYIILKREIIKEKEGEGEEEEEYDPWEKYPLINPSNNEIILDNIDKDLYLIPEKGPFKPIFCNLKPYRVFNNTSVSEQYNGIINSEIDINGETWEPVTCYKDYFDSYMANVSSPFVCFDAYPFEKRYYDDHEKEGVKLKPIFFLSLGFYSSLGSDFPFWATIQTSTVINKRRKDGEPVIDIITSCETLGKLRFSAFCSLAFGAQGLMYWRMAPGKNQESNNKESGWEEYCNAPINNDGTKNDKKFDIVKQLTAQIRAFQQVFIVQDEVKNQTVHPCLTKLPEESTSANDYKNAGLKILNPDSVSSDPDYKHIISSINSYGKGWAVSLIKKTYKENAKGVTEVKEYIIIVNLDWENSQRLNIRFKKSVTNEMYSWSQGLKPGITPPPLFPPPIITNPSSNMMDAGTEEISAHNSDSFVVSPQVITSFEGDLEPGNWMIFSHSYKI